MPASAGGDGPAQAQAPPGQRASAIALSHADKRRAPVVVAKGYGAVADAIVQHARDAGLYVHESPDLVRLLMQVNLDAKIPPQLYLAVAEVLAWLYRLEPGAGREETPSKPALSGPIVAPGEGEKNLIKVTRMRVEIKENVSNL